MYRIFILILLVISFFSCKGEIDYYNIPTNHSSNSFNAVIEIPSGTNKKLEYNKSSKSFIIDKKNGKERIIDFLPYPGNYGFIPSTYSDPERGGDGDALDVLVISEHIPTGTVIEITPIAMMKLIDDDEIDYKIIAVPVEKERQVIKVKDFMDFSNQYSEIKTIIELWFLNYNKEDKTIIEGWENEIMALNEINKSILK